MALKGTLKDFPISDIFQLIGQQQKSGSLYIRSPQRQARIIFDDGRVIVATFLESDDQFLLGTMLVHAGIIKKAQLTDAILAQKSSGKTIGDTLIQMKLITPQVLSEFIRLQVDEVLFRVFRWDTGFYEFIPEKIRFNRGIIEAQSAEGLLMDSFRKKDEWPRIEQALGDFSTEFEPTLSAAPQNEQEAKFISLFGSRNSLQEVIYKSQLGTFEGAKMAYDLLQKGALRKVESSMAAPVHAVRPGLLSWVRENLVLTLWLFGIVAMLPWTWVQNAAQSSSFKEPYSLRSVQRIDRLRGIENAIRMHVIEFGLPPASLDFVVPGISVTNDWIYEKRNESYVLGVKQTR